MPMSPENGMSPEEMAQMQAQAGKDTSGGITKIAQQVGEGLSQLSQALDSSPGVTPSDKQQMQQIMSLYVDLIEQKLGNAGPGEEGGESEPMPTQVPVGQGMKGVPVGPQARN